MACFCCHPSLWSNTLTLCVSSPPDRSDEDITGEIAMSGSLPRVPQPTPGVTGRASSITFAQGTTFEREKTGDDSWEDFAIDNNNHNNNYILDKRIYLHHSKSIQSGAGLKVWSLLTMGATYNVQIITLLLTVTAQKYVYPSVMIWTRISKFWKCRWMDLYLREEQTRVPGENPLC